MVDKIVCSYLVECDGRKNGLHEFDSDPDYAVGCNAFNECDAG